MQLVVAWGKSSGVDIPCCSRYLQFIQINHSGIVGKAFGIWLFRRVLLLRNLRRTSFWGACRRLLFVNLYIFLISSFVRVWFLTLSLQFPTLVAVRKPSFLEKVFRKALEPRLMALNCVCRHEYVYLGCVGLSRGIVAGNTLS